MSASMEWETASVTLSWTPSSTPLSTFPSRWGFSSLLILHNMSTNFQNPKNTPVTLNMKKAELTNIHVSQNVPQRSPMEVKIDGALTCQIQLAQSVPMSSPLTWELVGDPGEQQHSGQRENERDHLLSSYIQKSHGISSERIGIRTGT